MLTASSWRAGFEAQHVVQIRDRQQAAAPPVHGRAMHVLDVLFARIAFQANQFEQAHLRDDEPLARRCVIDQAGNDGQRQRDLELDRGALARPAEQIDHAADLLDVGLHHVHAHAAPGDVGDRLGGGESRQEDQVQRLALAQRSGLSGAEQALFDGLLLDARHIDARAVVADLDIDLAAFVIGAQSQRALRRLARARADFRRLRCRGRRSCAPGAPADP